MRVLRETDYVTVPWKNGGGLTREILKVPRDAAAFDWRLSLATIAAPGPFSAFDGYDRTLVLVRGAGVELNFGLEGRITLRSPGQQVDFEGEWATHCALLDGPSTDLNLIVSRARAEAQTRIIQLTSRQPIQTSGWEETLLCCISGSARVESTAGEVTTLSAVDVAGCDPGDGVVTCGPHGSDPALLLVASVRHRPITSRARPATGGLPGAT